MGEVEVDAGLTRHGRPIYKCSDVRRRAEGLPRWWNAPRSAPRLPAGLLGVPLDSMRPAPFASR